MVSYRLDARIRSSPPDRGKLDPAPYNFWLESWPLETFDFKTKVTVALTAANATHEIRYTIDGSPPSRHPLCTAHLLTLRHWALFGLFCAGSVPVKMCRVLAKGQKRTAFN
jgi:hypothetical protein